MKYAVVIVAVFLLGCKQPDKKAVVVKAVSQSDLLKAKRDSARLEALRVAKADSVKQDSVLTAVLKYAYKHINGTYSDEDLNTWKDSLISCRISFGHIFSKDKKHLIVQNRIDRYQFHENVFLLEGSTFKNVIKETVDDLTYVDDFIKDVNGDGDKDFLLNWYPESGCCARNVFNVYLYQQKTGGFTARYQFMNPNFFPKEKLIRGVDYGHPGEVPLYKYKWNGLKVDTIEYIYPADTLKEKFYCVHLSGDEDYPKKRAVLRKVPKEYRKIDGYAWFIDYEL